MGDSPAWAVPRHLDDPERWLFWTLDEAALLVGGAIGGLIFGSFLTGLGLGIAAWTGLRRLKRGGRINAALYAAYWLLPDFAFRLTRTPPSHIRFYAG